ncbi:STAS domain-containing protein [Streptomyces sp. NBC_00237]|uniref:STAS domain-containing protein n=1 Tax=Streptomyces sp. NBC_00237 TaxID=2975687 RepID=UPI00225C33CD|nr:STAS domain-containing protein [Streptomyces sp. NBC_00237]MCX5205177.1 STAS domain-containing protein [Streptomyces sp. NBC_00237]
MTTMPPRPIPPTRRIRPHPLHVQAVPRDDGTVRLELHGDLDYDHADRLLTAVREQLADRPGLRELRLDCADVAAVDSMGLSVLLMVHRATAAAGARLHLDARTPALERLLQITGTLEHFTGRGTEPTSETH